ncbi:MAG: hypothetical protein AAF843_03945 [Bacteroidota bacterium]
MRHLLIKLSFITILFITSCNDDDVALSKLDQRLIIHTAFESSSFLGTHSGLDSANYSNDNAFEEVAYPFTYHYRNYVFTSPNFYGDVVKRYRIDDKGNLSEDGQMVMEENSFPSNIYFVSDNKAYISLTDKGKVVVFNPTTLEKIDEIDLLGSEYVIGADNNPDPGAIIAKDGKLFITLQQKNSFASSENGAHILVVDENTLSVEKMISDTRLDWAGRPGMQESFIVTENGDLYVYCLGSFGYIKGQSHGFLRIKNGETEFDPDYVFNLSSENIAGVEGGFTSYINQAYYDAGNTLYFTVKSPALALDQDFFKERPFYAVKADLVEKKIEKLDIPLTSFYSGDVAKLGDEIIFSISSESAVGLFTYNTKTGVTSSEPVVKTAGDPIYVFTLE